MTPGEIQAGIEQFDNWYHAIRFADGVVSPGRFSESVPPNYTLFPVFSFLEKINLNGIDAIDIGTTDGLISFIIKSEGAGRVVATDRGDRDLFRFGRDVLNLDVQYVPASTLDGGNLLERLSAANLPITYDLVVLSGVIYHSYDPLVVMMQARKLLKHNGLLVVESAIAPGEDPILSLNWESREPTREANTYFLPTLKALGGMLRFCSCSCLTLIQNGLRGAAIGQACRPSEIADGSDMLKMIIEKGSCYGPIKYGALEVVEADAPVSTIEYFGPRGEFEMDARSFLTRFFLQPDFDCGVGERSPELKKRVPLSLSIPEPIVQNNVQPTLSSSSMTSQPTISPASSGSDKPKELKRQKQQRSKQKEKSPEKRRKNKTLKTSASLASNQLLYDQEAGMHTQSGPESVLSGRLSSLVSRIVAYYSRWPIVIAVLAIALNTIAVTIQSPVQWLFMSSGTALLLFLIGHAASKADYALQEVERLRVEQQQQAQNQKKMKRKRERLNKRNRLKKE